MAKNKSDGVAVGIVFRKPASTRSVSFSGTHGPSFCRKPASSSVKVAGSPAPIRAVVSVLVVPINIGTLADTAGPSGSQGPFIKMCWSSTGLKLTFAFAMPARIWSIGSWRSFGTSFSFRPMAFSRAWALRVPSSGVRPSRWDPLWTIARWNRPRACGMAMMVLTFAPPPDWPKMVTLAGSPPNSAMLSCTQRSAATRSSMPALPDSA